VFACDAFDAMIRDRPYCAARTPEEAIAELRSCSGTQFEPQVVDAVIAVVEERLAVAAPVS
jgi:HD-GYP domain-containing protein (c-di-GMP phosphodiesterase class II)